MTSLKNTRWCTMNEWFFLQVFWGKASGWMYFFISILISFSIMMQNHVKWKHKSNLSYRSWMQCELIMIKNYCNTIPTSTYSIQHCVTSNSNFKSNIFHINFPNQNEIKNKELQYCYFVNEGRICGAYKVDQHANELMIFYRSWMHCGLIY